MQDSTTAQVAQVGAEVQEWCRRSGATCFERVVVQPLDASAKSYIGNQAHYRACTPESGLRSASKLLPKQGMGSTRTSLPLRLEVGHELLEVLARTEARQGGVGFHQSDRIVLPLAHLTQQLHGTGGVALR